MVHHSTSYSTPKYWLPRRLVYVYDLLISLVSRDMKLRYKRSVLGMVWSLLNPLAQLLVLNFVFSYVLPLNIPNYTAFLFTGILVWNWFRTSLYGATGAIVQNSMLVRRPGFPVPVLPVVTVMTNLLHFLLALPILFGAILLGGLSINGFALLLPLLMVIQFAFTLGLAYVVASIHVTFRDTQYLLDIFLLLGFYLSPIFYTPERIPEQYLAIYRLNPMMHFITAYRRVLIDGVWPTDLPLGFLSLFALALLLVGYTIFKRASHRFVEEL